MKNLLLAVSIAFVAGVVKAETITYSKVVNAPKLVEEIRTGLGIPLARTCSTCTVSGVLSYSVGKLEITLFEADDVGKSISARGPLSAGDRATLDAVVAAHVYTPLKSPGVPVPALVPDPAKAADQSAAIDSLTSDLQSLQLRVQKLEGK